MVGRRLREFLKKRLNKFLLSEDYEKTKEFFEFVKTGGETINLTDLS